MSGRSSKTPLSTISRVGSLEDKWFLMHFLVVDHDLEMPHFKFLVSRMSGRSSKIPLSTISRGGSLEDKWFLMHTVWIVDVLEVSSFKFHLSLTSGTPSKTPLPTISWLDPWRTWLFHLHLWIGFESYHKFAPQMFKIDPLCHQYWCFILCRD